MGPIVGAPMSKVGTCEWDVNIYKESGGFIGDIYPVDNEGPGLKIGTAWATW